MFKNPDLRTAFNASDNTKSALDIFHLEEEPTKRLMDFCEKYHVSLACLLLMGLRTYLQKMNGFEDVSINNAIARRATLKEKKCGGTRIHSFPIRTIFPEDMKFIDGVYAIRDKQNEIFRHANYDPTAYFAYRSKIYPQPHAGLTYESISLTYQPMTLKENGLNDLGDIRYKTKWYPNGTCPQGMYLTVMHRPEDNGLDFNFEHQIKAVSRDDLEYLYYYLCKIMFKGTENPDLTIGDIIKLFEKLVNIICNYVEVEPENIHPESRFMEDLGFTSFDFMSMLGEIEDEFDIEVEQSEAANIRTVQEAVDYLEKLTAEN